MNTATNTLIQEKQILKTTKNFYLLQKSQHKKIRSPLFYVGDKYKIIDQIKKYFPKCIETFIEPFTGGGSVFLNTSAQNYLLNDIDKYLIKLHKFLNSYASNKELFFDSLNKKVIDSGLSRSYIEDIVPKSFRIKYPKTYFAKFNKENYIKLRHIFNANKEDMFILYLLLIYGFNRMLRFNSNGDFNLPVGNVDLNMNVISSLNDYFENVQEKNIIYNNLDYKKFLYNINFKRNDFVYLDPPYLISFSEYNKLWNETEEKNLTKLLDKLDKQNVKWAISNLISDSNKNTHNELFDKWMQNYNIFEINSNYISFNNNKTRPTREVLITNYEN